jgi:hypothetical protein
MSNAAFDEMLRGSSDEVIGLARAAADLIRKTIPDAAEEVDKTSRVLGFTFAPGTYRHLIAGVAVQKNYVNIMFSKGVELIDLDSAGLLEGTGKVARHIKVRSAGVLADPCAVALLRAAAARTPRP